ncbi:hypothetical protein [Pedobacter africanus]|uniref:CHRD domain-containing protein n=1 Tax=Pedobacter africanus TaxID=151894 RepID=A0A1W1YUQ2_9SPHI|nr:hypothetical protein [Pedobacter africanus]SMC39874.1 hypothetical protein SAMN04488524_0171 [Pedobacter africanus]
MKNLFIPLCAALIVMFGTTVKAQQETAKGLIVNTSSQAEVDKILESLKGQDPSTYRFTVTNSKGGRLSSKTYGTAALGSIGKIGGTSRPVGGGVAANDIVILVKNVFSGKEIQDAVISKLNTNLSKQAIKTVQINRTMKVMR